MAETIRGGAGDAPINRIVNSRATAVPVVGADERVARDVGMRLGAAPMLPQHTIYALIVASAVAERAEHMMTGDRHDIARLAGGDLTVIAV